MKDPWQAKELEMLSCCLQRSLGQIDTGVPGAICRKHHSVRTITRADLQDRFPLCVGEGDQQGDVPFGAITVFTVSVEEIPLVFILFDKVGAARRGVPK